MYPKIIEDFIPQGRPNRPGLLITPEFITIHSTGNRSRRANSLRHASFLKSKGYYELSGKKILVSWHFTVDDNHIIQHLPIDEMAYHAGKGNRKSLGIEICMNEGINQSHAITNTIWLVAKLLKECGLVQNAVSDSVVTHNFWSGKNCPEILLEKGKSGKTWQKFISSIENELTL